MACKDSQRTIDLFRKDDMRELMGQCDASEGEQEGRTAASDL